jgi:hypothetical protein
LSPGAGIKLTPGSFQIELAYLLGSIATGVLFAVIYQALTGTLWGMSS